MEDKINIPLTEAELKAERHYRYEERLALLGVYGIPSQEAHNIAFLEANLAIIQLRRENSLVTKLRELRLNL